VTLSILIVDDHPLVSTGLAGVLKNVRPDVQVTAANSGVAARQALGRHGGFDLVLLDLGLPDIAGFDLLAYMRQQYADVPVLVVSASESLEDMRRAMAAGAAGFVGKAAPPEELLAAVNLVVQQDKYWPALMMQPQSQPAADAPGAHGGLSQRQLDVLRLMCAGRSNKVIAYELGVAEKTVKGRVTAIFKEMQVDNRMQAVLKAAKLGLFPLAPQPVDVEDEGT
jgi:two-component system, NarL family, nitrate/nitrite response regulator NarL